MEARELRIGNLIAAVSAERYIGAVRSISNDRISITQCSNIPVENCFRIPLTEEWLLKFGFELYENAGIYGLYREIFPPVSGFEITADSEGYWYWPAGIFNAIKIKSVHQLQNLYFALTGEELTAAVWVAGKIEAANLYVYTK